MDQQFGIIDLGSNSVRLVIYRKDETETIQELDNVKSVLRLSAHINEKGEIDKKGKEKLIHCLRRYARFCKVRTVERIYGIATAAIRSAKNRQSLLETIEQETGIRFRVLEGEEEAYYGFLAVVNTLDYREAITVDIGGGSTEITYFKDRSLVNSFSFPFGVVTLLQTFGEDMEKMRSFVIGHLRTQEWIHGKKCPVIVMGGTARNLARIHQRKINYSLSSLHNYVMQREEVVALLKCMKEMPLDQRKEINGLSRDRVDILPMGLSVFLSVMDVVGTKKIITSNKGLRDGFLFEMQFRKDHGILPNVLAYSTEQFMKRYRVHVKHNQHVAALSLQLFDSLKTMHCLKWGERERTMLNTAALLHDIGRSINMIESTKHTFYLIENVLLLGVTHRERILIGLIASYKNNKQLGNFASYHRLLINKEDENLAQQLGTILSFAINLDRGMDQRVEKITAFTGKKKIVIELTGEEMDWIKEHSEEHLKKLEKICGQPFSY